VHWNGSGPAFQADRLGDLDTETLKVLNQAVGQEDAAVSKNLARLDQRRFAPPPGTVLVRRDGRTGWLCLERQILRQSLSGRLCHHRDQVEWPPLLWIEGQPNANQCWRIRTRSAAVPDRVRCAIYTRVSTDQGLDQYFNSLDAQYEAASAYIKSQAHAGWALIQSRYDDGGYSGGSTDRPNLQQLLDDVRCRKIDVIVVYKVDRLTRSLADFAKLVELVDAHDVSFVSVTQQFNTTTSMGRLTLNVLLSFAQFEREVTSERIRDKIAASKRKGIWVGGPLPLGYDLKDGAPVVVEEEAERVQLIFRRYLQLSGTNELVRDLRAKDICTKARTFSTGETRGGIPFGRGALSSFLRNRFFIGEVKYKGEILPGEQPAILD